MTIPRPKTIDAYIANFPKETWLILEKVRTTIQNAAPAAKEVISCAMPTFRNRGVNLVHFAGHKNHIGFTLPRPDIRHF